MEEKNSGKKKTRTTNPPAEASVTAAATASLLTDDLIVEILSRLPARSVHRFKCVSPSWRDLIADPAHRKKLPHTLAGFLYGTYARDLRFQDFHFADVSAGAATPIDPSLPFLPRDKYGYVAQLDSCNGLLLCRGYMSSSSSSKDDDVVESHYIVCNPATGRWLHLPPHPKVPPAVFPRLAFDPAVLPHFHVLQLEGNDRNYITGVTIYSSQTGVWKRRESRLLEKISLYSGFSSVFFQGMLHLLGWLRPTKVDVDDVIISVDMEGQVWKTIRLPSGGLTYGTIGLSQGCLHYATTSLTRVRCMKGDTSVAAKIVEVWCMKDYGTSKEWVLRHRFSDDKLRTITGVEYKVAAIHPDCDTIFLDTLSGTLASYDMQHQKCRRILNLEKRRARLFRPYVPLFSDSFAGANNGQ